MNTQTEEKPKEKLPLVGIGPKILIAMCPVFILFGIFSSIFYPIFQIPLNYYMMVIIGTILITCGIFVFIYSERILSSNYKSSELITTKIYAYVRHPMYASWGLGTLPGIFCLFSNWILFLILFIYYLLVRIFLRKEERFLIKKYGKEY